MAPTIELQLARRSVRAFLPDPVSDAHLDALVAAAQSAPTSSNLQAWTVVAVRDPERKARLAVLAADQRFVGEASLLLVWLTDLGRPQPTSADLGRHRRLAEREGRPLAGADHLESTLLAFLDVTLAAQNAIVAVSSLGLGSVCVGALRNHPEEVAAELGLPPGTVAVLGLEGRLARPVRARRGQAAAAAVGRAPPRAVGRGRVGRRRRGYDQRLAAYDAAFGREGTWSERVLRRLAGPESLAGRDRMRDALAALGWPSR